MNIPTALGALKTAADLGTHLRSLLKQNEQFPVNEILARIIEMQDLITDGRSAIIDFQEEVMKKNEEIQHLKEKLHKLEADHEFRESLTFEKGVYKREGPKGVEVYCAPCFDETGKRIRVAPDGTQYWCHIKHGSVG